MTRNEMLDVMDRVCDSYTFCTGYDNHPKCPLFSNDSNVKCAVSHPAACTDEEIKRQYDILVGGADNITDPVSHPSHYNQGNIQCIDAMVAAFGKEAVATWCKINAFKYIWREEHKNGIQDIDKAIWYLNKYKELTASGE